MEKESDLKRREEEIAEKERELSRREEIVKMQNEILKIKEGLLERKGEVSKDTQKTSFKMKNALIASEIMMGVGIILFIYSPILAITTIYKIAESILKESPLSIISLSILPILLNSTQILGIGLIFIGSAGIIASLICGYRED